MFRGKGKSPRRKSAHVVASASPSASASAEDKGVPNFVMALPSETKFLQIVAEAMDVISQEDTMLKVTSPVIICGDIHGQVYDLLNLFSSGSPSMHSYLFLGDYVDRGLHSLETVFVLLSLKKQFPRNVHLLRGNHESRGISQIYGFYDECIRKYGNTRAWDAAMKCFDFLPLCALIDGAVLCMHGGLSPSLLSIDQLAIQQRGSDIPLKGIVTDTLWADPHSKNGFAYSERGISYNWGPDVTDKFCHENGIELIGRAHQVMMEGYNLTHNKKVMTIFSAPNYCYTVGNVGAVCHLSKFDDSFLSPQIVREMAPTKEGKQGQESFFTNDGGFLCSITKFNTVWAPSFVGPDQHMRAVAPDLT